MPMNGEHRRIYPEPAPRHDRSPADPQKTSVGQVAAPIHITSQTLPSGASHQQRFPPRPQQTPLRGRPFANNIDGYDGSADRHNRLAATTLKQSGPMRAGSEPQRSTFVEPSIMVRRSQPANPPSKEEILAMKVEVPDTIQPKAPPMKHQMSQSTDASLQERGRPRENVFTEEGNGGRGNVRPT